MGGSTSKSTLEAKGSGKKDAIKVKNRSDEEENSNGYDDHDQNTNKERDYYYYGSIEKRRDNSIRNISWFPHELVIDIFKRVDDGSCIVRLRCLSKSWYRILSHLDFIHDFLSFDHVSSSQRVIVMHNIHRLEHPTSIIQGEDYGSGMVYSLLSYDTLESLDDGHLRGGGGYLPPEVKVDPDSIIIGCCDGILCISSRRRRNNDHLTAPSDIVLWNPTTGEAKLLPLLPSRPRRPPSPSPPGFKLEEYIAFGFNPNTSDYKIVVTHSWFKESKRPPVDKKHKYHQFSYSANSSKISTWIFSLRDDKWTKLRANKYRHNVYNSPIPFAAGSYKLIGRSSSNSVVTSWCHSCMECQKCYIMSFDLIKQAFEVESILGLPTNDFMKNDMWYTHDRELAIMLHMLKQKCLLAIAFGSGAWRCDFPLATFHIWGMLNYNKHVAANRNDQEAAAGGGNWMELHVVGHDLMCPVFRCLKLENVASCVPGIRKDGYYYSVTQEGELNAFNPQTKHLKHLGIKEANNHCSTSFKVAAYTPSNVSLSGLKKRDEGGGGGWMGSLISWFGQLLEGIKDLVLFTLMNFV